MRRRCPSGKASLLDRFGVSLLRATKIEPAVLCDAGRPVVEWAMCGRYALYGPRSRHRAEHQYFEGLADFPPSWNVAPSQTMPIARVDGVVRVTPAKWGFVPCWSTDWQIGCWMINARAETITQSKAFGPPYRKKQRCLVPADGFYEWQKRPGGKQPMYITSAGDEALAFAGLVEFWKQPDGETLTTYTVITGDPNELVRPIHNRMPVILDPADYDRWLYDATRVTCYSHMPRSCSAPIPSARASTRRRTTTTP